MKKDICIIDDDAIYQILMGKIVKSSEKQNNLITFKNGQDAIDNFCSCVLNNVKLPDIILLDIEMPMMDGWEFMVKMEELIKKHSVNYTKIYIVSSSISYEDIEKSKTFKNILGFYSKPISSSQINQILAKD